MSVCFASSNDYADRTYSASLNGACRMPEQDDTLGIAAVGQKMVIHADEGGRMYRRVAPREA